MKKRKNTQKVTVKRDVRGQFMPGSHSNPMGRPPLGDTRLEKLLQAVARIESKRNINLLDHFIERGFDNDGVLIAVMKKLIPDLKSIDISASYSASMSDELAASIQKKLQERFQLGPSLTGQKGE